MKALKAKSIRLERVDFIPTELSEGVFYFSAEFQTATHLCCCGCLERVITPIGLSDWSLTIDKNNDVTLHPSVGNWEQDCRSHYWIKRGKVIQSYPMTPSEIERMRINDDITRRRLLGKRSWWRRIWDWLFG